MLRTPIRTTALLLVCVGLFQGIRAADEQPVVPVLINPVNVRSGELEIEANETWSGRVAIPSISDGERPMLALRAYAQAGGGCNYVLQVLIDGLPLSESPMRRRLLNKLPWFDPPDTEYHFSWYDSRFSKWMTMFGQAEPITWGGTGRDTEFLFDLTGLVTPGGTARIEFRHAMPGLPAAIHRERAPLVLSDIRLGVLKAEEVSRLRARVQGTADMKGVPVRAELPADAVPGPRPYEVEWSGRRELPVAQVAFGNLNGWEATVSEGIEGTLEASVDYLLWRQQVAKLEYSGTAKAATFFIRPPEPIEITGSFDAASLWLYAGIERMKEQHPQVTAYLEDSSGRDFSVDLGLVRNSHWVLLHGVLPRALRSQIRTPVRFLGVSITVRAVEAKRRLYLESLAFYERQRKPFTRNTRPEAPTFPYPDGSSLPIPRDEPSVTVQRDGEDVLFAAENGLLGTLQFRVNPADGLFNGIRARHDDGPWFQPMAGGELRLELNAVQRGDPASIVSSDIRAGKLLVRWRRGVEWQAEYSLQGRTLVVDVDCKGGAAEGLRFGRVRGLPDARPVEVPYLRYGQGYCTPVACGHGMFVSVLPDWYHCDCSVIDGTVQQGEDGIALMTGTDYRPLTNGRRNDLRERVMVTVSPEFAGVLPNIPHPPSPHMERLAPYMFCMVGFMRPTYLRTLKRYGIDHVIACDFARFYVQDFAAGFAGRWRPHPSLTMKQIQDYRQVVKDLGYLFGAYSDIRDWFPLNEFWDENCVSLSSDGDLVDGWYGNFRTKPNYLPVLARLVGEKVHAHYPPDSVYMDTHSCVGLGACDYEAGVPGAGNARDQVLFNSDCIMETKKWYGTVMSEAAYRWLYAGIVDMDYGSLFMGPPADEIPPLVDFDLLKIHHLNFATMMGYGPSIFFARNSDKLRAIYSDDGKGTGPIEFYKYVSASLAYGHMLMTGYSYMPRLARMIHLYALMQGLQKEYLTDGPVDIAYHNGTDFTSTSTALLDDTQKLGRVRVKYFGGMTIRVNYNADTKWAVDGYALPPFGWLVTRTDKVLAFSALLEGERVDYVRCPGYIYMRTGDRPAMVEALEVQGGVWLKREAAGWRLLPCGDLGPWERVAPPGLPEFQQDLSLQSPPANRGCARIVIDTRLLLKRAPDTVTVEARNAAFERVPAEVKAGDRLEIVPTVEAVDYLLR